MPARSSLLLLTLLLLFAACSDEVDPPSNTPEAPPTSTSGVDPDVVPVAPERVQALLPDALAGRPQTDVSGSVRGALGVATSVVQARYGEDDSLITLTLTDVGGLGSPATLGYGWVGQELDRTWDEGTERTLRLLDYPAYERAEEDGPAAAHVFVGDRIMVELSAAATDLPVLRRALRQLPLDRLAALPGDA